MAKTYTITTNGLSNGNVIVAPFTIEIHQLTNLDETAGEEATILSVCTVNGSSTPCANDDLVAQGWGGEGNYKQFPRQASNITEDAQRANTIEVDLEAAYPGAWS